MPLLSGRCVLRASPVPAGVQAPRVQQDGKGLSPKITESRPYRFSSTKSFKSVSVPEKLLILLCSLSFSLTFPLQFLLVVNNVFCRRAEICIYYCFSGIYLVSLFFYRCEYFIGYAARKQPLLLLVG